MLGTTLKLDIIIYDYKIGYYYPFIIYGTFSGNLIFR